MAPAMSAAKEPEGTSSMAALEDALGEAAPEAAPAEADVTAPVVPLADVTLGAVLETPGAVWVRVPLRVPT